MAEPAHTEPAPTEPARVVPDLLRARVRDDPGAPALAVDGGDTMTFAGWERRSAAIAGGLAHRGVRPADRVALLFDNARWTDYAAAYLGVLRAGAVAVPLGPRFSPSELAGVLRHCEATGLIAPPDLLPDRDIGTGWLATAAELEADGPGAAPDVAIRPDDLAEIIYTSGTTGLPKGVACTHANVVFHDPPPEGAPAGPMTFVHAFPVGTNAGQEVGRFPLRGPGRTAIAMPVFDPERLCALVAEHRVRNLQLVPAMARLVVDSRAFERHDVSSLRRVTLSSAPAPASLLEEVAVALPRATLWNTYALTEAGTARTLMVVDAGHRTSVGRGVGGTRVRVVDAEGGDVPAGATGEVWIGRPGAPMRWYYRDPEATARVFVDGWVRTGDVGHLDEEGYLYLTDRRDDLIITGGLNVSSVEVEGVLHEHPAVADAAVFGVPHPVLGQDVAAAVVLRSPVGTRELQSFARDRLGEHKTPHRVVVVDGLPRNASGKVLKRRLREDFAMLMEPPPGRLLLGDPPAAGAGPVTDVERVLASIWAEVLGRDRVGVDDDFFDLGGHSLAATQLAARANQAFGVDLPVDAVFDHPTVAELARLVEDLQKSP